MTQNGRVAEYMQDTKHYAVQISSCGRLQLLLPRPVQNFPSWGRGALFVLYLRYLHIFLIG